MDGVPRHHEDRLFPAPAGMIPQIITAAAAVHAFPRTRGDDPRTAYPHLEATRFSPHPRG